MVLWLYHQIRSNIWLDWVGVIPIVTTGDCEYKEFVALPVEINM